MANKEPIKEDAPPGVPGWMLTFCDCMTLLLTFFVLLLSFSSFDEASQRRLDGALRFKPTPSSLNKTKTRKDNSVSVQIKPVQDLTAKGAEVRRDPDSRQIVKNPKQSKPPKDTDDYNRDVVLSIPLDELFMTVTPSLTASGKADLGKIASFLELMPLFYVVVGQSVPDGTTVRDAGNDKLGTLRAWIVLQFIQQYKNLPPKRFWLSGQCPRPLQARKDKATMQIVLLKRNVIE